MSLSNDHFELIPATFKGHNYMKIQCNGENFEMKLKGKFQIFKGKFGLQLFLTLDDFSPIEKIHELAGIECKNIRNTIFLNLKEKTQFSNKFNKPMNQPKPEEKKK